MDWDWKSVGGVDGADGKLQLGWQTVHKEVQSSEIEVFLTASSDFPLICKRH